MKQKYLQLISDFGVFAIGNFLVKFVQFFLLPLYTAAMSTEEYGIAELLNNISEIVFPIMTLAICEAVFRFSIEEEGNKAAILYESLWVLIKGAFVVIIVVSVLQYFVYNPYVYHVFLVIFCYSVRMLFANYAKGSGYVKCFSLSGIVNALALAILDWLFLIRLRLGTAGYLMAIIGAHLISAVVLFFGTDIYRITWKREKNLELRKRMLKYAIPLMPNSIAWWVISMSSKYIILYVSGPATAGLYTAANKLPAVVSVASQVFQQSWQLNASRVYKDKNASFFYENILKIYTSIMFIIGSFAICSSPMLSKYMLNGEFYEARKYVPLMMLTVVIQCMTIYFGAILIAFKQTKKVMYGMVTGACANVIISMISINYLGIWGVLTAGILCYLIILFQRIRAVNRLIKFNMRLSTNAILLVIMGGQSILISQGRTNHIVVSLLLMGGIVAVICFSYHRDILHLLHKICVNRQGKVTVKELD